MAVFYYVWKQAEASGGLYPGAVTDTVIQSSSSSLLCSDIQTALNDTKAPGEYPVECNFVTLESSGSVYFTDTNFITSATTVYLPSVFGLRSWMDSENVREIWVLDTLATAIIAVLFVFLLVFRRLRRF